MKDKCFMNDLCTEISSNECSTTFDEMVTPLFNTQLDAKTSAQSVSDKEYNLKLSYEAEKNCLLTNTESKNDENESAEGKSNNSNLALHEYTQCSPNIFDAMTRILDMIPKNHTSVVQGLSAQNNDEISSMMSLMEKAGMPDMESILDCIIRVSFAMPSSSDSSDDSDSPSIEVPCKFCSKKFNNQMSMKTHIMVSHEHEDTSVLNLRKFTIDGEGKRGLKDVSRSQRKKSKNDKIASSKMTNCDEKKDLHFCDSHGLSVTKSARGLKRSRSESKESDTVDIFVVPKSDNSTTSDGCTMKSSEDQDSVLPTSFLASNQNESNRPSTNQDPGYLSSDVSSELCCLSKSHVSKQHNCTSAVTSDEIISAEVLVSFADQFKAPFSKTQIEEHKSQICFNGIQGTPECQPRVTRSSKKTCEIYTGGRNSCKNTKLNDMINACDNHQLFDKASKNNIRSTENIQAAIKRCLRNRKNQ